MKIQDLEKISEYFDEESNKPQEIIQLLHSSPEYQKAYKNFQIVSEYIKKDSQEFLNSSADLIDNCWSELNNRIEIEENKLNELLKSAFILPSSAGDIDLWDSINEKIDNLNYSSNEEKIETIQSNYSLKQEDWELLLHESFKLPQELEETDIWSAISQKLDSLYHIELFSENLDENSSEKERFFIGLSEYFDGEVSANKAQIINDHLLECSSCRSQYLSLNKLKTILKQTYTLPTTLEEPEEDFWLNFENTVFPQTQNIPQKKLI